ncbi:hypothetical protein PHYSODRAFT_332222 [Phytophthora sojae]|uniref:Uncharacterized protein n=1 Tax=Phytophthora sojae (strain P6497) TaxID=1094619 RepID=G4ZEG4_PHYSP|nr:hypothetical protein PHYSODRAFT_332222 [Phytophthora sojae]EGZ18429.1 hypothetical protein PHYSODRAFT_332222 [Phytophthora sojae]|eukprot:XP_009527487.1 hypothetical protein PHYSODRAFT_332222 [Phytophthora sojae]
MRRVLFSPRARQAAATAALRSLPPARTANTGGVLARTFASASPVLKQGPPRWRAPTLLALTFGAYQLYKTFEEEPIPGAKEQERLLNLAHESATKGDRELAAKYVTEAYEASKGAVSSPAGAAVQAGNVAMAMKHGKTVEPPVLRYLLGIKIMYKRGQCYLHLEQYENAEKVLLKAIRGYEKFQGQFSLSQCSPPDVEILDELEESVFGLFAAYTILLIITDRQNEIPSLRERLLRVVRNSETLREGETEVMDQFDDGAALIAIQEERRRKRQGESGEVKSHSA